MPSLVVNTSCFANEALIRLYLEIAFIGRSFQLISPPVDVAEYLSLFSAYTPSVPGIVALIERVGAEVVSRALARLNLSK